MELCQLIALAEQYHTAMGYIEHMLYQQLEKVCVGWDQSVCEWTDGDGCVQGICGDCCHADS